MKNLNVLDAIAVILVVIGGLNWGLVGLADFNLVSAIFGETVISSIVYALVGLAAIYVAVVSFKLGKK
ncbi:MAG: hypothetical protein A2365_02995 [Candidatus Nealsonbacteria bacterium RIFOXYB1_FULL_40_15]|uniref:DUF378 domain-containing protein n=2 Tax=Candidatus Nealsoniibacteriota TaxID=1817911 RepID=A0A1G2ETL7_9BACT|nr:MAG: hypothetical protein A2365_02995 [Candidatus Nealsonbacteria bacterium RIFOXYB1_FULL_40_15]OGZ29195.1 MAG: hypothetical protein A2427_02850 [Candidatus Nealsonbacteria bacterium RIFOXYC1_FULL_40_7]OGZ29876.1 MAG: hypothetical protein A2562_02030 [Candidatus Nealsonbacteria bacterium RIFOXYD1_FULL_39_11]